MRQPQTPPDVATVLLEAREAMSLLFDTADGMRKDLESRGWSPTMAEHLAGRWLGFVLTEGKG